MSDVLLAGDLHVGRSLDPTIEDTVRTLIGSATHALVNLQPLDSSLGTQLP